MAAKFDLNDDGVVVIVGSGAGGGTLGNELAQKGIKVVVLEAGPRVEMEEFVNNEWDAFSQISWLDKRTTSGSWRVAKDFAGLPAWIVKAVGGSTIHWAGASLRFQEHEFKTRTHYGDLAGANLLDWPITLKELEPYYAKAESKMGVTGTNGIPRLPGNNNYKVLAAGAKAMGYKEFHSGNMAINSQERDNRGSCQQIGFCFQGCKSGAKWSTLIAELPKGEDTGNLEVRSDAQVLKIEHDASGKVTGVLYGDKAGNVHRQKARIVAVAGNSIESPRLLLNSASAMFPDGLANSSGQVGRNYMRHTTGSVYATFENPVHMYRGTTMAGIVRDEARFDTRAVSPAGTSWKPCRWDCPSWRPSSIRGPGAAASRPPWTATTIWPGCGSWARTCPRKPTGSRRMPRRRTSSACRSRTSTSMTIPTMSPCATMPTVKDRHYMRRWEPPGRSIRRLTLRRIISAPTG